MAGYGNICECVDCDNGEGMGESMMLPWTWGATLSRVGEGAGEGVFAIRRWGDLPFILGSWRWWPGGRGGGG